VDWRTRDWGARLASRRGNNAMFGWIVRGIMVVAGVIAGWFVASDSRNFDLVQMAVALILITFVVFVAAFWPAISAFLGRGGKPRG